MGDRYRWVSCESIVSWDVSRYRHLLPSAATADRPATQGTTLCGASGMGEGVWRGSSRKPPCTACLERARELRVEFPAIGDVSEGRGELAGGDVQAVRFTKKVRRPSRHDQRTPLPGDADWKGRHG